MADSKSKVNEKAVKEVEKSSKRAEKLFKSEKYSEAAAAYQEAARLAETAGDKRAVDLCLDEAKCHLKLGKDFNAGWAYKSAAVYSFSFNDFSNSINLAGEAVEYFIKSGSMYAVQWCYNLMGQAAEKMGDYGLAAKNYKKSLDIEYSEEIEKRIGDISKLTQLTIEHAVSKDIANEGEKVEVTLTIRNDTKESMSEIKILGEKSNELESIPSLAPGEAKAFRYKMAAWDNPKPLFCKMTWKGIGSARMEREISPPKMCVIPNIEVNPYLNEKPEVGRNSHFVISVANNSKRPIEDVNLEIRFPVELKVSPVTGYCIDRIEPGEEEGFVFKILPTASGRTILKPAINFRDSYGRSYIKNVEPFVLEETLSVPEKIHASESSLPSKPATQDDMNRLKYTEKFKRYISSFIMPKEIDKYAYVSIAKNMRSSLKGYTLSGVDIETASSHVVEECKPFAAVSGDVFDNERLYLFAGQSNDGGTYLLTAVLKEDDGLVHIAFKLYSDRDDTENVLEKIADVVKYTIIAMSLATEIQKIEVNETINIVDSIVQRSKIGEKIRKKDKNVDIKDSVVQKTDL